MDSPLLLQLFISNNKLDNDTFDFLSKKESLSAFYDAGYIQRFYNLINGVSQSFSFEPIESMVSNYAAKENSKKEQKIVANSFNFDVLGLCLLKKSLIKKSNLKLLPDATNSHQVENYLNENIDLLLKFYDKNSTHFNISKNKIHMSLNILEMGYLIDDTLMIQLGKNIGNTLSIKNIKPLLKNFIYHNNQTGLSMFDELNLNSQVLDSMTKEQQFLFILNSTPVPSIIYQGTKDMKKHFEFIHKTLEHFNISSVDSTVVSTGILEHFSKNNQNTSIFLFRNTLFYEFIDNLLSKISDEKIYSDMFILKASCHKEGKDFFKKQKAYFREDINYLMDDKFLSSENIYREQIFNIIFDFINVKEPKSIDFFNSITPENFKKLIQHIEFSGTSIKDEQLALLISNTTLNLDDIVKPRELQISGVNKNKNMTFGNALAIICMNHGFINSFDMLFQKNIKVDSENNEMLTVLDVISNRKKTGIVYGTIVEKYKLANSIEHNDASIKKRVKI